jgi:hypothetical protein
MFGAIEGDVTPETATVAAALVTDPATFVTTTV